MYFNHIYNFVFERHSGGFTKTQPKQLTDKHIPGGNNAPGKGECGQHLGKRS